MMVKSMHKQYDLFLKTPVQLLSALLLDFVKFTHNLGEVCWPQHACKVAKPSERIILGECNLNVHFKVP